MRERQIEEHLKETLESEGFLVLKLTTPGFAGVPDRMILWPKYCPRPPIFVELKAPGKKPRPLQVAVIDNFKKRGVDVAETCNSIAAVDALCARLLSKSKTFKELARINGTQGHFEV